MTNKPLRMRIALHCLTDILCISLRLCLSHFSWRQMKSPLFKLALSFGLNFVDRQVASGAFVSLPTATAVSQERTHDRRKSSQNESNRYTTPRVVCTFQRCVYAFLCSWRSPYDSTSAIRQDKQVIRIFSLDTIVDRLTLAPLRDKWERHSHRCDISCYIPVAIERVRQNSSNFLCFALFLMEFEEKKMLLLFCSL